LPAQTHFTAVLTGEQEVPAVVTDASATATFTLTEEGLTYRITVNGLTIGGPGAHFHNGAAGANGPIVRHIEDDFVNNTATGIWRSTDTEPLTDDLLVELMLGNIYLNIHTDTNLPGEVRGQLHLDGGTGLTAKLTGAQEVPPLETSASGSAALVLTDYGLAYKVTVTGLTIGGPGAHFHNGAAGTNGAIVRHIEDDFVNNTAKGIWRATDAEPLTEELIAALLLGEIYFNVHTAANPPGEIRGQVLLNGGSSFSAELGGDQEVPAIQTDASGTASLVLTNYGLVYRVSVTGLTIGGPGAHFHNGTAGGNGPIVRHIEDDFLANTAIGIWRGTDAEPLTNELLAELLLGNIYLNVHTDANPAGEVRGQVLSNTGASFMASLTGDQEVPAVATDASATASFTLTEEGLAYRVTVNGLTIGGPGAHFHNGAAGSNGPIVRHIEDDFVNNTATGIWRSSDVEALTDELLVELLLGNIYLNIHTDSNLPGEVRGQVLVNGGTSFSADLTGAQEVPSIETDASGTASFVLTDAGLAYKVTVNGLTIGGPGAHFHNGSAGANGPIVRHIEDDFVNNTAIGLWQPTDAEPLTDDLVVALLLGNIYLNVHTDANPPGEVRGQVLVNGATAFSAALDGSQEVPPLATDASGTGDFTLTDAGLRYNVTVTGLTIGGPGAHFHNGALGANGPIVRHIEDDFVSNTAAGIWRSQDSSPLTNELLAALLQGNIYLNVHTDANPAGEVRGQLNSSGILVTSVERIDGRGNVPNNFELAQNFPNPFNPSTAIQFDLNRPGRVVLKIYNMIGQNVATIVDENLVAGTYRVSFEAANLPSGVYVYRLQSGGRVDSRKMLLLK